MQISYAVTAKLIKANVFCYTDSTTSTNTINFKNLAFFCRCIGRFVSDLVGNPKDWFFHVAAHIRPAFKVVVRLASVRKLKREKGILKCQKHILIRPENA